MALFVLAGCSTPPEATMPTPDTTTSAPSKGQSDIPWDHPGDGQPSQVDAPVATPGSTWLAERHAEPGDPFGVARYDGFPSSAQGYAGTADGTTSERILLPSWTVDGKTGAIVLNQNGPSSVRASRDSPAQLVDPSGQANRLDSRDYQCRSDPCDLAWGTGFHLMSTSWQKTKENIPSDACLAVPEQFPDGLALHFPLRPGQTWDADVVGILGIPVHQSAEILGFATLPEFSRALLHIRFQQNDISDCWSSMAMGWMLTATPEFQGPLIRFSLDLAATVDAYYDIAAGRFVLIRSTADYSSQAAFNSYPGMFEAYKQTDATADSTHIDRNGTYSEVTTWRRAPDSSTAGTYEDALRLLNPGHQLLPTGSKLYGHFKVDVSPPAVHIDAGEATPDYAATWSSSAWPAPELPSGVSWAWSDSSDWQVMGTPGGPTHRPEAPTAGSYTVRPQLVANGQPVAWAVAPLQVDTKGDFTAVCPATGPPTGMNECGAQTFEWRGKMRALYVNATLTGPGGLPPTLLTQGQIRVTAPDGDSFTADADAQGRAALVVLDRAQTGTWTVAWDGWGARAAGQEAPVNYSAIAYSCDDMGCV